MLNRWSLVSAAHRNYQYMLQTVHLNETSSDHLICASRCSAGSTLRAAFALLIAHVAPSSSSMIFLFVFPWSVVQLIICEIGYPMIFLKIHPMLPYTFQNQKHRSVKIQITVLFIHWLLLSQKELPPFSPMYCSIRIWFVKFLHPV